MTETNALLDLQETLYTSTNPTRRWLHLLRKGWVDRNLKRFGGKGKAALEIGPGCCVYVAPMAKWYETVTVSDVEESYLVKARKLQKGEKKLKVEVDDLVKSRLKEGAYDTVLCSEVVEHLPPKGTKAAFKTLSRLPKMGGVLLLSTPQRYSTLELCGRVAFHPWVVGMVRRIYDEPVLAPGHINLMTAAQVRALLEDNGMVIQEHGLSGLYIPLLAEFGGAPGRAIAAGLEKVLKHVPVLKGLLWTQYWVARRVA